MRIVNKYKRSLYNVFFEKNNHHYIFNILTNALLRININVYKRMITGIDKDIESVPRNIVNKLLSNGILIEPNFSEADYIKKAYLNLIESTDYATFTIYPTFSCNFKCKYCIQRETEINDQQFNSELVIKFIEKFIYNKKPKKIVVVWSGGEPLLKWEMIKQISERLIAVCSKAGVEYGSQIVTNGYLLNKYIAKSFSKYKISHAQITLDGTPEYHNNLRVHNNSKDTFSKVLGGILNSSKFISTTIRVNINEFNFNSFEDLIILLKELIKDNRNILINPKMIVPDIGTRDVSGCYTPKEYGKYEPDLLGIIMKHDFRAQNTVYSGLNLRCAYYHKYSFNICSDMKLYKCSELVGFEKYAYGEISDSGRIICYNNKNILITGQNYCNVDECVKCNYLPKCMGKCVTHSHIYNNEKDSGCVTGKFNLISRLKLIIE